MSDATLFRTPGATPPLISQLKLEGNPTPVLLSTSAVANFTIDAGGLLTEYWIQLAVFNADFATGYVFPGSALVEPGAPRPLREGMSPLAKNTDYKWRVIARNTAGTTTSDSVTFRTGNF
jgi:hypothetical protein